MLLYLDNVAEELLPLNFTKVIPLRIMLDGN